ncbi:hypothetical protein AVEN_156080-1 [Araneus ventricosus]|uniref:Uncharacterized protein n=1 Tax=Araneus ventricosus TaxID=182803 RepID=A0A4Y2T902_ARAVE|nr:hypothetical protein AVEN_156080-1 [Araneus ventricosus]
MAAMLLDGHVVGGAVVIVRQTAPTPPEDRRISPSATILSDSLKGLKRSSLLIYARIRTVLPREKQPELLIWCLLVHASSAGNKALVIFLTHVVSFRQESHS